MSKYNQKSIRSSKVTWAVRKSGRSSKVIFMYLMLYTVKFTALFKIDCANERKRLIMIHSLIKVYGLLFDLDKTKNIIWSSNFWKWPYTLSLKKLKEMKWTLFRNEMYDNSNNQHGREKVDAMATMPLPMEIFSSLYEVRISYDLNSRSSYQQEIDFETAPK